MRIVITSIVDVHRSPNTRLHHFLDRMSADHDLTILCPRDNWREEQTSVEDYGSRRRLESKGIDVHHISESSLSPVVQTVLSEYYLTRSDLEFGRYDLHFDYNTLFLGNAVGRRVRKAGIPIVYDLADDIASMVRESPQLPSPLDRFGGRIASYLLRQNTKNATQVTCISETLADEYPGSNVQIITNGVDTDSFRPGLDTDRPETPNTQYTIGYVGTNREWVDLTRLVDVTAELRDEGIDVGLLVVGEEGGIDHVVRRSRDRGIESVCTFPGTVPYSVVPNYVNAMDIGTIPFSKGDISSGSLPLKLFEYLACGVPVVSSRIDGVERAAGDVVRFADDSTEILESCRTLLAQPQLRKSIGEDGRDLTEREFSWDRKAERLEECFRTVA